MWKGAERAWGEADPLQASSWSSSNTGYVALPEGANVNSPDANWVFDYGAYLPVSGRNDNIYYRIKSSNLNLNSILVVNHNATETAYYSTDGVYHPTGGSTAIKLTSNTSNSVWKIGTFTYTGAKGSYDRGVALGSSVNDACQADIVVGEMNIGQIGNVTQLNVGSDAAGTCYATIDENNVKKGDAVSLSDSGGPKTLTINGDFNIYGNSAIYMNVWDNAKDALHSEENPDISIGGVVRMVSGSGASPVWHVISRSATVTWATGDPAPSATDTYVKLGGLEGNGKLTNNSRTLEASTLKLIFTNQTDCEFTGEFNDGQSDTVKTIMSVKMAGADGKKQIIRADSKFTGTVEVESGTLIIKSTNALGKLTMTGGAFGGIDGGVIVSGAEWFAGDFIFYNKDTLGSGDIDMIRIDGAFVKSGDGKIGVDFDGFDPTTFIEDDTVLDLISASAMERKGFSADANDDFYAKNLTNGFANFEWNGDFLTVSFSNVPEPATVAAILGGLALAAAALRRRKSR
ncbi:MAG TPA: PEP-CTERM sorting domain-containing protein [Candidatus Merdousia gallistercoris]|nr:PEP-CTERM sorting domain-containing protein [Candidatus Merdousia gallistercoris]